MDWITFVATMTGHLAWPIALVVILLTYRQPIVERIRAIRKFKYQELELDLSEELRVLSVKAEEVRGSLPPAKTLPTLPAPRRGLPGGLLDQARAVGEAAPVATILLAWSALEQKINDTVTRLKISPDAPGRTSVLTNIELLEAHAGIERPTIELIRSLRRVRNEFAHLPRTGEPHVKEFDALRYLSIVEDISALLDES